jgi:hypothetical protein
MKKITKFLLPHRIHFIIYYIGIFIFGIACEDISQNHDIHLKTRTFAAQQPPCDGREDIPFGPEQCIYLTTEEACAQHQDQCQYIQSYRIWMEQEECMYEDWEGCIPRSDGEEGNFIYYRLLANSLNRNQNPQEVYGEFVTLPYKTNYAHQFHPCLNTYPSPHVCLCNPTPP